MRNVPAPLTVRLFWPRPVMVTWSVRAGRLAVRVIVWPMRVASKLIVSAPAVVLADVMAERRVTVPAGGAAVSAVLLTVNVAGTQRSSSNSRDGRTRALCRAGLRAA